VPTQNQNWDRSDQPKDPRKKLGSTGPGLWLLVGCALGWSLRSQFRFCPAMVECSNDQSILHPLLRRQSNSNRASTWMSRIVCCSTFSQCGGVVHSTRVDSTVCIGSPFRVICKAFGRELSISRIECFDIQSRLTTASSEQSLNTREVRSFEFASRRH